MYCDGCGARLDGFTGQYEDLQKLAKKISLKGAKLEIEILAGLAECCERRMRAGEMSNRQILIAYMSSPIAWR